MATRLAGASASTAPARAARMTTATTPTQPSASESQDRAPTPSWEEVGVRDAAAKDLNWFALHAWEPGSSTCLACLCVSVRGTLPQGKVRAAQTARPSRLSPGQTEI